MKNVQREMYVFIIISSMLLNLIALRSSDAQVPPKINYQGYLKDSTGNPVNRTVQMTLSIYDVATGGTALWSETQNISVNNGIYNVILGSINPVTLTEAKPYWLGVRISPDNEMTPRQEFTSALYSLLTNGRVIPSPINIRSGVIYWDYRIGQGATGSKTILTVPTNKTFILTDLIFTPITFPTDGSNAIDIKIYENTTLKTIVYSPNTQIHFDSGIPFASGSQIVVGQPKSGGTSLENVIFGITITGYECSLPNNIKSGVIYWDYRIGEGATGSKTILTVPANKTFILTDLIFTPITFPTDGSNAIDIKIYENATLKTIVYSPNTQIHFDSGIPFAPGSQIVVGQPKSGGTSLENVIFGITVSGYEY